MEASFETLTAGNFPASQIIKKTKGKPKERGKLLKRQNMKLYKKITPVKIRKFSCQPKYSKKTKRKPKEMGEYIEKANNEIILKITQVENYRLNCIKN